MTNPIYVDGGAVLGYPGPIGPQGPAGTGVVWQGAYTSDATYVLNDAVSFEGQSFVLAVATVTGVEPGGEEWSLLAARGEPGPAGPQGEIGERGLRGFTGLSGIDGSNGEDGRDGSVWHVGTGAPQVNLGNDTDLYLDSQTGNVYTNAAHVWSATGANLTGPKGDRGDAGTGGGGGVTDYNDLENRPSLSAVALSGQWTDVLGKPSLFDGNYNSLSNRPSLFSGLYGDLQGAPTLSALAISGQWSDIQSKPVLFDGNYNSLTNRPVLFDGSWTSLSGKPALVGSVLSPTESMIHNLIFSTGIGSDVNLATANSGTLSVNVGNLNLIATSNGGGTGDILIDTMSGNVYLGPNAPMVYIGNSSGGVGGVQIGVNYSAGMDGYADLNYARLLNSSLTGNLDADGNTVTGLKTPVADTDAAPKKWVEDHVASKLPEEWTANSGAGSTTRLVRPTGGLYYAPGLNKVVHYTMLVSGASADGTSYGTFEFTGVVRNTGSYDGSVATMVIGRSSANVAATAEVATNGLSIIVGGDVAMTWKSITTLRVVN
jgi:hypothetical protein